MPTTTTNYSFNKPVVGGDEDDWGGYLNGNWDTLDTLLGGVTNAELSILDGATVTTAELNILDGVTATAAELNILDGVTATAAELNALDGITATVTELNYNDITTLGTVEASKVVTADANGNVRLPDNGQLQFGTSADFVIQHNGADTIMADTGTGDLYIRGSNDIRLQSGTGTDTYAHFQESGFVKLYHNNSEKFVTTSVGADVTGEFIADSYNETYVALSGTSPTVNCESGNVFALSTTGNTTFTFSNPPASGTAYGFVLKLTAGGTHTITYPASVDWAGGTAPDAPASGETDVLVFYTHDGGTTWYGALSIDAAA
jgi:hypothetical protein